MTTRLSLLLFSVSLCLCGESSAAQDAKDPYRIKLVVHVEKHPQLTKVFRERVERDLRDGVQAALETLAKVEVTDTHPELPNILRLGMTKALDGFSERSAYHTHFVLIDFSGTHYRIRTRMHDGPIGHPSPIERSRQLSDREFVARAAAFLLERDLGLLGTVEGEPQAGMVKVALRGGGLGVDLGRWVKKGEVFRLGRVGDAGPAQLEDWTCLQVVEPAKDGVCTCKLFSRYKLSQVAGLRAEMLGTHEGPLRLRFLEETPKGPGPVRGSLSVQLRKEGFDGEETRLLPLVATSSRDIDTARRGEKGKFDRLAFVTVLKDEKVRVRVPVPIVGDGLTVIVVPKQNAETDQKLVNYRRYRDAVLDAALVYDALVQKVNEENKPDQRAKAIASVREAIQRLRKDHADLTARRIDILAELQGVDAKERPDKEEWDRLDKTLKYIKTGEENLEKHVGELEKIEKEENDPERKEWKLLIEKGKSQEKDGDLGKAIATYKKALEKFKDEDVEVHLKGLEKRWEPKSKQHGDARDFILKALPKLKTEEVLTRIGEVESALAECVKVDDGLTVSKLQRAIVAHVKRMEEELAKLKPETNDEDKKAEGRIRELTPKLEKVNKDAAAFLEKKTKPAEDD